MLGKIHFATAILFLTPLAAASLAVNASNLPLAALLAAGCLIGVLLPDADEASSKIRKTKLAPIGAATWYALFLPLSATLNFIGFKKADAHRGVAHSLIGVVCATALWAIISSVIARILFLPDSFAQAFAAGIALGYVFHLLEDSLTVAGVRWLYPKGLLIRGCISTHYSGLRKKSFWESESFAGALIIAAGVINAYLLAAVGVTALGLAFASIFELALIAAACRMEVDYY